ncbi:MAG: exodeoxyribonuclease I [Luminiphilus sp.]|nr:exodeoxyribonuclease I [Luminiphilus sp.]
MSSSESFYWHDYETSGANVFEDRPLQFAGVRTDKAFNVIGDPLVHYCRPSPDCLLHPAAIRVTGISPYKALSEGSPEGAFMAQILSQFMVPGTCALGYNSVRFDDEITRFALYRNFFPPYAREFGQNRSRWDLIDVARAIYALRPEGVVWPTREDGLPSFRLEDLTAANGIDHGNAHDALADVLATIALARLFSKVQPVLFDTLYAQRVKQAVAPLLNCADPKPVIHVSGQFGAQRSNLAIVLPLAPHPRYKNEIICADLGEEPAFFDKAPEDIRQLLFTPKADLPKGVKRPPIKTVKLNRAPVVLPTTWVSGEPAERLGLDGDQTRASLAAYGGARKADPSGFTHFIQQIYADRDFAPRSDPDTQLYDAFLGRRDEALLEAIRCATPTSLANDTWTFEDRRLPEVFFRYRARNFPESLKFDERARWREHCRETLADKAGPNWEDFNKHLSDERAREGLSAQQITALDDLEQYMGELRAELAD